MIACIDVDYDEEDPGGTTANAACVVISGWSAAKPIAEHVRKIGNVAAYVPGRFFERELPCVLAVLELVTHPLEVIVIDGYVVLDETGTWGMGGFLWAALGERIPVVGVAKNRFRSNAAAIEVYRGGSKRPLFVTALGVDPQAAANDVQRMHGEHRLPTALKRVDRLCRDGR
ncbi:MAG TPA: endonuclease V [Enhygromyxa sp.]|nr:endonuclease V [Enhygromyxa sp.]